MTFAHRLSPPAADRAGLEGFAMSARRHTSRALVLLVSASLAGCAVGPNYHRPNVAITPTFKEAEGWTPARPADGVAKGAWWSAYNDPVLDDLERKVEVSNQNLAAAEAAYRSARALVAEDRATLFPTVDLTGSATRSGRNVAVTPGAPKASNQAQSNLGASWAIDVWGRIRRTIEGAKAQSQASAADLANAKLTAQSELAADYFQLRVTDTQKALLTETVSDYARSLQITQNQYNAGVVAKSDLLTAQTQLTNARASLIDLDRQRSQSEHAIAVLTGQPPADLTLAVDPNWTPPPSPTPVELPSTLLQRRPDIAAAERAAANANAQIGVQTAGYFPSLTLTGNYGFSANALSALFKSSNAAWSIGGSAAQTVFDAGATSARVRQARAGYDQSVAQYRQTVLTAFQQVEDQLAAARVLQNEEQYRVEAAQEAVQAAQISLNQYRAGQVAYTAVAVSQATALSARQSLITLQGQRLAASVSLIEALGGGWSTSDLPK
jgi:NodT family efflux transporter outer membrane factor (OMF) lipoprotein